MSFPQFIQVGYAFSGNPLLCADAFDSNMCAVLLIRTGMKRNCKPALAICYSIGGELLPTKTTAFNGCRALTGRRASIE